MNPPPMNSQFTTGIRICTLPKVPLPVPIAKRVLDNYIIELAKE